MGSGRWNDKEWSSYSRSASLMSRDELYTSRQAQVAYDSRHVVLRESRDSTDNPNSTPIILGLDVTGSMGVIAEYLAKTGLGKTIESVLERRPVSDPHLMVMAIGDAIHDKYPLQITQFEADNRLVEQLTALYLEGGGGGNNFESYDIPWMFAANNTAIDSFEKRGVKGYLFTVGDELCPIECHKGYNSAALAKVFGNTQQQYAGLKPKQALEEASKRYHVFHLVIEEGSYCRSHGNHAVYSTWDPHLGNACIGVKNYKHIAEIITSIIQVSEGENPEEVINSWQDSGIVDSVRYALFRTRVQ